jgi:hypothetical protein
LSNEPGTVFFILSCPANPEKGEEARTKEEGKIIRGRRGRERKRGNVEKGYIEGEKEVEKKKGSKRKDHAGWTKKAEEDSI